MCGFNSIILCSISKTHIFLLKNIWRDISPPKTHIFFSKNIWRDISPFKSLFFYGGCTSKCLEGYLSLYGGCTSNLVVFRCRFCPFGVGPRMLILKYIVHLLRMSSFQQIKTTNDIFLVFH